MIFRGCQNSLLSVLSSYSHPIMSFSPFHGTLSISLSHSLALSLTLSHSLARSRTLSRTLSHALARCRLLSSTFLAYFGKFSLILLGYWKIILEINFEDANQGFSVESFFFLNLKLDEAFFFSINPFFQPIWFQVEDFFFRPKQNFQFIIDFFWLFGFFGKKKNLQFRLRKKTMSERR